MVQEAFLSKEFEITGGDFGKAGDASMQIKALLKKIGVAPDIVRRTVISTYEAEMNVCMYARKGVMRIHVSSECIDVEIADEGNGIEDIELAMQEGYSTATEEHREFGFGAGMGLPNIKKNSDEMTIESEVGTGTKLKFNFTMM